MKDLVIGLDLGTTACKAVSIDAHSHIYNKSSSTHTISSPKIGWTVQDVNEIWSGVLHVLKEVAQQISIERIAGISMSGAMQSLLPVDEQSNPLALAMTWADNRSAPQAKYLRKDKNADDLLQRTGCPLQHVYNPARIRWWMEEASDIAEKTRYFIAIKDWILYKLCGRLVTDIGLASTTGLLNIRQLTWDEKTISVAQIQYDSLPPLVEPTEIVGELRREVAELTGLPVGLPVIAGTSDGGLANLGSGALSSGDRIVTVGTSGAVRMIVDQPWVDPLGRTWCYVLLKGRWFAGGAINNGGLTIQWVREKFYPDLPGDAGYQKLSNDAGTIAPGAEGVFVLPYLTGERSPFWDPDLTAVILGLDLRHDRRHIARAAMEGVAFCLANIWEILHGNMSENKSPAFLTGSISRNHIWAEIVANVLGVPLIPVEAGDASAIGAAILGHFALGNLKSIEGTEQPQEDSIIQFNSERHLEYSKQHTKYKSLVKRIQDMNLTRS
jgi:gluconokinase